MPYEIPERDPIKSYVRRQRRKRRFPSDACCTSCGETRLDALIQDSDPIICFRCEAKVQAKSTKEKHHLAGQANHPGTVEVDVNDHRAELSPAQYKWPQQTMRNPDGSPLLVGAACIRGVIDWILFAIKTFLLWVADMLEDLDEFLKEELGPTWWRNTPFAIFAGRRSPHE